MISEDFFNKNWDIHEAPGTLHLTYPAAETSTSTLKKITGLCYKCAVYFIKDRHLRFSWVEEDIKETGKVLFENPEKVFKLGKLWQKYIKEYKKACEKIKDLEKLSKKELIDLYKEFYKSYVYEWAIPSLANTFDFYFDKEVSKRIENYEDYIALTHQSKESFSQKEVRELLSIKNDKDFLDNIKKHAKKYFWLENNYADTKVLREDYFIKRYKEEKKVDFKKIDKSSLIKKYNLDPKVVEALEECIYWRDERKMYNMMGDYYLSVLLEEIGKRNNISLEEMKYTLPNEIENPDKKEIKKRQEAVLLIITPEETEIYTGKEAVKLDERIHKFKVINENEIKGNPASKGKAIGIVKVVMNKSEFQKLKKGEILITSMTRPEYVPLMRKSAAIVTDEGGLTCHAAIVSRELGKPCVIGTKVATRVLKDGDLVEVDANKGIVRRIE
ncbi:MAG: PEP-utilizing enzyme [Candidatus Woesearchaeota archaeon]